MTTDKVTDWTAHVAERLVDSVRCVLQAEAAENVEQALECVLSTSCAGPRAIERARQMLGMGP